jgi:hypothetical protein
MNKTYLGSYSWPPKPSKELLKRAYNGNVPRADNLLNRNKRVRLKRFTGPFKGDGRKVTAKFGRNLDTPLSNCFEEQLEKFVNEVLNINWDKNVPMTGGIIRVLKRMGRAGVLYRHGFSPEKQAEKTKQDLKTLEMEIAQLKKQHEIWKLFETERKIRRLEARDRFNKLQQENQNDLLHEYEHAQFDRRIKLRGGEFEDFLILKFCIKIDTIENFNKLRSNGRKLKFLTANLKENYNRWRTKEFSFTEFAEIFKDSSSELERIDSELKSLSEIYR